MMRKETSWLSNPLEHLFAVAFLVAAFAVLMPWGLSYSTEVRHLTEDQIIAPDAALSELRQLSDRIYQPGFTPAVAHQVIKRAAFIDRHTPWIPKALVEKARARGDYAELRALEMKQSAIFRAWGQIAQTTREVFRKDGADFEELHRLEMSDPELQTLFDFRATTVTYHWGVVGENLWAKLPFGFAFAFLYFIAMIKARKLNLAVEIMNPLSLILATATFPVSWLVYPYKDRDQRMSRVVNVAGMAFSLLMSFGGVASAQTVKKGGKKQDRQVRLQTDTRAMFPLGDDPENVTLFNRATIDFGGGVVENISLGTPSTGFWYSETCGGPWLGKVAKAAILAVGCVTKAKGGDPGWAAGLQAYRPIGKRFFLAVPVARMEGNAFNFLGILSTKIGKGWSLSPEMSLRLAPGQRRVMSGGISLSHTFGRGSAEAGILRTGAGQPVLRSRLIQNFAF